MSISPETIIVIPDTQENYIIYDREITENPDPKFNHNILVTKDNLSNRLYFNMWYTFDDIELIDKEICIIWQNANNEKGITLCTDKELVEDRLIFAWDVPVEVTHVAGIVNFSVRITTKNYIWNSLIGHVEVRQGIQYDESHPAVAPTGWVNYIQEKYSTKLKSLSAADYASLTTKDNNTMYIVINPDTSVELYLGDTPITLPAAYFDMLKQVVEGTIVNANIPEGITKIKSQLFKNSSVLQSVTIPSTVTTIEDEAFSLCTNLRTVYLGGGITSIATTAFYSSSFLTDIYINLPSTQTQITVPSDKWGATNATIHWTDD